MIEFLLGLCLNLGVSELDISETYGRAVAHYCRFNIKIINGIFMNVKILFVIAATVVIQSCSSGLQYTPLSEKNKNKITNVNLYNLVLQDEVKPSVELSNVTGAMGGGLVPALIDASINSGRADDAQQLIQTLYNNTEDYDFRIESVKRITPQIQQVFQDISFKPRAEAVLLSNKARERRISQLEEGSTLLYLSTFYKFINDSKNLSTETVAFLYTKPEKKKKKSDPIYYNSIYFESDSLGEGGADSLSKWNENNGELFISTLNDSIDSTADILAYDLQLQSPLKEQCNVKISSSYATHLNAKTKFKGQIVKATGEKRHLFRSNNGFLLETGREYKKLKKKLAKECQKGAE